MNHSIRFTYYRFGQLKSLHARVIQRDAKLLHPFNWFTTSIECGEPIIHLKTFQLKNKRFARSILISLIIFSLVGHYFQHLVDWSRGMVSQISSLGANYTEWVNKPVDRPLRLFDSTAIEMLTKTPWWLVPGFWIPIIIFLIKIGINDAHDKHYGNVRPFISLYCAPFKNR